MIFQKTLALLIFVTSTYEVKSLFGFLRLTNKEDDIDKSPPYQFGNPTFFGSGCPDGAVRTITSSDNQTFSVIFSQYVSETSNDRRMDRSSCNLAVSVDVKEGYSIGIFKTDYRGFTSVPESNEEDFAKFYAEYFFAGIRGPTVSKHFPSGTFDDFFISDDLLVNNAIYTPCGASTVFRINTSITATKKKENTDDVFITVDTIDTAIEDSQNYGFHYHITEKKCEKESSNI